MRGGVQKRSETRRRAWERLWIDGGASEHVVEFVNTRQWLTVLQNARGGSKRVAGAGNACRGLGTSVSR